MIWARPGKFETFLLTASLMLGALGAWKRYQDLDDLALAQAQLTYLQASAASPGSSDELQKELSIEHRNSLLAIAQKEQALNKVDNDSPEGISLRESIEQDSESLLPNHAPQAVSQQRTANLDEMSYDAKWESDSRRGLRVDLGLIAASMVFGLCAAGLWTVDIKRSLATPS